MILAVYGRNFPKKFNGVAIQMFEAFSQAGFQMWMNRKFHDFISANLLYHPPLAGLFDSKLPDDKNFDMLISIGGDGSFLEAITYVVGKNTPVLGVNTGKLGFLANVGYNQITAITENLSKKNYTLSKRLLLSLDCGETHLQPYHFALNEFTLQKLHSLNMIKITMFCNDEYVNTYWADGIIIATPTGSTAYSLSCGGPILVPESDCFLVTPIANHNLSVRPLVIPADASIKLSVEGPIREILATLDYRSAAIKSNIEFTIKKSEFNINVVNLPQNTYFSTLREKLLWGIDIRN